MPKFKLQVLEAQDLEKELLKGLRERLGANNLTRRDKQLLELDIKFKGLPFLDFEFNKFCIKHFQSSSLQVTGLLIQDIGLYNVERNSQSARNILTTG
jgi:hypothetical protein